MDFLCADIIKDEYSFHRREFRVIQHPYVRLPSLEMYPNIFISVQPTFKRFMTQKSYVTQSVVKEIQLTGATQLTTCIKRKRETCIQIKTFLFSLCVSINIKCFSQNQHVVLLLSRR